MQVYGVNENHPIKFDEEGNLIDQTTGEKGMMKLPDVVVIPKEYRSSFDSKSSSEFFNALTLGGLNNLSPTQWARRIYDLKHLSSGDMKFSTYTDRWLNGNEGIVTRNFSQQYPLYSLGINLVGDGLGYGIAQLPLQAPRAFDAIYYSNRPVGQYLRFIGGKFKYGFDAKLPVLYRRISNALQITNNKVQISPINNRFAYQSGEKSPLITNFTTDQPVLPNNGGDWTGRDIVALDGNILLGKNIISTRPSDTFTFGDIITVPKSKVKIISGNGGDITSNKAMSLYSEYNSLSPIQKGLNKEIFLNYEQELRNLVNNNFKAPTIKDYEFMDYVFAPKYSSQVVPKTDFSSGVPAPLTRAFSNAQSRRYLFSNNWRNVMYDPATTAEDEFRKGLGIVLKSKIPDL